MKLAYDLVLPPGDREVNLPPVILLHGMMDSRKTWKYLAPDIARQTGRKVYSVDARNHGSSPWHDRFDFDVLAEDLDNFLGDHNMRKAALVGHSMGGRTALTLALKEPEKVEKLIVEDMTTGNFKPNSSGHVVQMVGLLRASLDAIPPGVDEVTAKKAIIQFVRSLLPPGQAPSRRNIRYDLEMLPLKRNGDSYSWQANLDVIEDMLTTDKIRQALAGVYMGDAMFLYGTQSFFKVKDDQRIPKLFPRSTKVGFEEASHLIHFEFPAKFVEVVSNFINGGQPRSKY